MVGEHALLQIELGARNVSIVVLQLVAVFDDAADLDVGHSKDFGHDPDATGVDKFLFVGASTEWNNGAVGVNGPAFDGTNRGRPAFIRNFELAELLLPSV